jgi:hypothetical protein
MSGEGGAPDGTPGQGIPLATASGHSVNGLVCTPSPIFDWIDVAPSFINWRFTFRVR